MWGEEKGNIVVGTRMSIKGRAKTYNNRPSISCIPSDFVLIPHNNSVDHPSIQLINSPVKSIIEPNKIHLPVLHEQKIIKSIEPINLVVPIVNIAASLPTVVIPSVGSVNSSAVLTQPNVIIASILDSPPLVLSHTNVVPPPDLNPPSDPLTHPILVPPYVVDASIKLQTSSLNTGNSSSTKNRKILKANHQNESGHPNANHKVNANDNLQIGDELISQKRMKESNSMQFAVDSKKGQSDKKSKLHNKFFHTQS